MPVSREEAIAELARRERQKEEDASLNEKRSERRVDDIDPAIEAYQQADEEVQSAEPESFEWYQAQARRELARREIEKLSAAVEDDQTFWEKIAETPMGHQLGEASKAAQAVWNRLTPEARTALATIAGVEGLRRKVLSRVLTNPATLAIGSIGSLAWGGYQLATNDDERDKFNQAVTGRNEWPRKARPTN